MSARKLKTLKDCDSYDFLASREDAAKEKDCYIVYPEEDELQIDIDTPEDYERFEAAVECLPKGFVGLITEKPSISGYPHRHITIRIRGRKLSDLEKIALQFTLGSDFIRESLGVIRTLIEVERPTCFFEKITEGEK